MSNLVLVMVECKTPNGGKYTMSLFRDSSGRLFYQDTIEQIDEQIEEEVVSWDVIH